MNITINITADSNVDHAVLSKLFAALGPQARETHTVVAAPVTAPPTPKIESVPAPPLAPELKAELDRRMAENAAADAEAPVKRKPGRPPNPETAARRAAEAEAKTKKAVEKASKEWTPPVPRPEGGFYGKQEPDPKDSTWEQRRAEIRQRLKIVLTALNMVGLDHQKFLTVLLTRYGDGKMLSTVPQGNLAALIEEAEAGPAERPLTRKELEAAERQIEQEAAQKA